MSAYVLNQSRGHWLLNDTLNSTISMSLKFKDKIEIVTFFNNLMDEDGNVVFELACLISTSKKKLLTFWILFFPFKKKY